MNDIVIKTIGKIERINGELVIKINNEYKEGLLGLKDYSHVQVLWWADKCDNETDRNILVEEKPYKNGPDKLGIFALRSPERINPIMVSNVDIAYVDVENGIIGIYYIDAFDGTSIIDLKPYTPSIDRIENFTSPSWCSHWPKSYEESSNFNWEDEFNF